MLCSMCQHGISAKNTWRCPCGTSHCRHIRKCETCGNMLVRPLADAGHVIPTEIIDLIEQLTDPDNHGCCSPDEDGHCLNHGLGGENRPCPHGVAIKFLKAMGRWQ